MEDGNLTQYISHLRKALGDNSEDTQLIVTIARKGYQFTGEVIVYEADPATQGENHVPGTERSRTDAAPTSDFPGIPVVPDTPKSRRKGVVAASSIFLLALVGYISWRHYQSTALPKTGRVMLAVPPFENLTGDPNKEYLADGLTEETISQLGRLNPEQLGVIARTSVMGYKHKDEVRVRLTSQQQAAFAQSHSVNPEAFDAYLQGQYYFERDSDKDTEMAAKYFERATQLDPSYALAWVGLSRARKWQAVTGLIPREEGYRIAREADERALALNPNLAEAHAQMGRIKEQVDFDWTGGDASYGRAVELEPGNSETVRLAGGSAAVLGRLDEALQLNRRAVDLDPLNAQSWEGLGEIEFRGGKLDEAEADLKKAHELRPDDFLSSVFLSEIYVMQGQPRQALPEIERVGYDPVRKFLYAIAYHVLGRKNESDAALMELIAKYQAIDPYLIAEIYAFRNQSDEAFEWLDRAYAKRDDGLIHVKVEPLLKSLQSDARFTALLKKLNLPA